MSLPAQVVEKYVSILNEFFHLIQQSDIMQKLNYPVHSLYIGINALHRVFEFVLLRTKNIEKAYYYSQKTYYYYLEYIEQIHKSNLSQSLNHLDAILFVYKKTIFSLFDGTSEEESSDTMSNIMTLNETRLQFDEKDYQNIFVKISKFTNLVFDWKNENLDFENRMNLCNMYLFRFLKQISQMDATIDYLEILQTKIKMNYLTYEELLKEILEKRDKSSRSRSGSFYSELDKNEYFLMKFYIEETVFREKFDDGNMKEFVRWMYQQSV
jgi:hypothetical protein